MQDSTNETERGMIDLTVDIVSAYVSNNSVPSAELGALIASVHTALGTLSGGVSAAPAEDSVEKPTPAQIRKSVRPDSIISFVDGKSYKTLKRHLSKHGLDPVSYRNRYGLPADYPMVSPSYSEQRSALARSLGLGRKAEEEQAAEPVKGKGRATGGRGRAKQTAEAA